jgi:predicted HTH transcriptional regulator
MKWKQTVMENHSVEWKSSFRNEYLAEVCGFANAQGGVLEIGCFGTRIINAFKYKGVH